MTIVVANLTLRFYCSYGWTENELRKYLIDKSTKITYRDDLEYYAVYENCGYHVFKRTLLNNEFINSFNNNILYYIGDK